MSKTIEQEREEKVKLTNRKCQQMDAAWSVASRRASFQLPRARVALAGLLVFAAAGFAAMSMKPPKLPWVAPLIPTVAGQSISWSTRRRTRLTSQTNSITRSRSLTGGIAARGTHRIALRLLPLVPD